jgi:hypothetical protein
MKRAEEDDFKDKKNASMKCPWNKQEIDHLTIVFRAKNGVNAGKLFWKCMDCNDPRGMKGKLIGMDSELETDGLKTIDAGRVESSTATTKRQRIADEAIIASGRGVNWSQLASDVSAIREGVTELIVCLKKDAERAEIARKCLSGLADICAKPVDTEADAQHAITAIGELISNGVEADAAATRVPDDSSS